MRILIRVLCLIFLTMSGSLFAESDSGNIDQQLQQLRVLQKQQKQKYQPMDDSSASSKPGELEVNTKPKLVPSDMDIPVPQQKMEEAKTEDDLNEQAFKEMAKTLLPMSSDQIHRLKQMFEETKSAAVAPAGTPPRPVAGSLLVNLAPGATPPAIRLAEGFVSSLVFVDSTGAPWPIEAYDLGNPQAFNIQWNQKDNTIMIQALTLFTYGNLAVRLKGLQTPVMLTLIPGQKSVDYRVDLRIQGYGPNATQLPQGNNLPSNADPALLAVLDGVPPSGAHPLKVNNDVAEAWAVGNKMYLRTQYAILSPGWISNLSSADGMKAYLMAVTPMLLVSVDGKVTSVKIEGF